MTVLSTPDMIKAEARARRKAAVADLLLAVDETIPVLGATGDGGIADDAQRSIRAFAEELGYELTRCGPPPEDNPVAIRRKAADRNIQKAFRRIGERDGFHCRVCGIDRTLTVDHVISVLNHGTDDDDNLQLLCRSHNSSKGTR